VNLKEGRPCHEDNPLPGHHAWQALGGVLRDFRGAPSQPGMLK
jgi:hypothetical protein